MPANLIVQLGFQICDSKRFQYFATITFSYGSAPVYISENPYWLTIDTYCINSTKTFCNCKVFLLKKYISCGFLFKTTTVHEPIVLEINYQKINCISYLKSLIF